MKLSAWDKIIKDELIFQSGYSAKSGKDCPHLPESFAYQLWMEGYHRHQEHRRLIKEVQKEKYCKEPLSPRIVA